MEQVEIPQCFICPISLEMMKDPVTTVSGITYDRESIEQWLSMAQDTVCPVTKEPLTHDSHLTPNHNLRRLIQAWCVANADNGMDRIPTPKAPIHKSHVLALISDLNFPHMQSKALKKLDRLASENAANRTRMAEAGAVDAMVSLVVKCFRQGTITAVEEALRIIHLIWTPNIGNKKLVRENIDLVDSIVWVLHSDMANHVKTNAVQVLKTIMEFVTSGLLERLKLDFFREIVRLLRAQHSDRATKAALHILIEVCPWGRNRAKIVEAGAVFDLVELELDKPEKSVSELIFCLLAHLCSCARGREELMKHAGGVAMVAKRILRVSPAIDDRAIHIFSLICRFSATQDVLLEMLRVRAVSKLCMVLQANCANSLKEKSREILKLHSNFWNSSPCISVYLFAKNPR